MKAMIHCAAFAPQEPNDPHYEERCIRFDAERAAKMGEPIERACSWEEGTHQHQHWLDCYWAYRHVSGMDAS